ncbi:hypothetical protein OGE23_003717 [Vibrio cholerae]|uniref:hypothetical protein n=1 Tax=Vibrio TaxID=662 RepID=UPI0005B630BC|nr:MULTISPECIES: hypothetical protein [Vibrio]EJL6474480.1 hypothetical protein [Vibrio cholerae]EJY4342192.1 hypothetical protein [Vibrio cholerae]QYO71395.1 hypothetical protein KTC41_15220 [Vibrio cholerae]TQP38244.1 hypothetical protein FLL92_02890 [Vibrio cholerae]TQP55716.1 hypothetical protein FLL81_16640 [Vibrio cholerae]
MIYFSSQHKVSEDKRFFEYSLAYLKASKEVCIRMLSGTEEQTPANADVSMMLAAHATELFLKSSLVLKTDQTAWGHSIDELFSAYLAIYPEEEFYFACPFITEYLGFDEESTERFKNKLRKNKLKGYAEPSVKHRYPVHQVGIEWVGERAFEPKMFLETLVYLDSEFNRLVNLQHNT